YLLVFGGGPSDGAALGPPVGLEIMAPVDGAEVNRPLEIVFRTEAPISVQPGGWGTGGYHLHADLSGIEVMPGPQDIRQREDGAYTWVVSGASPGELSVRLLWSDAAHRPVAGGGTDVV